MSGVVARLLSPGRLALCFFFQGKVMPQTRLSTSWGVRAKVYPGMCFEEVASPAGPNAERESFLP